MTKRKNNKRALIVSALSLLLCVSMLVGSTMAWFTDNASTAVNKIESGTLDIGLEMLVDGKWENAEGKTLNFVDKDENKLWEPGVTYDLPQVRVVNKGNLAVKLDIIVNGIDGDAKLNEAIEWTFSYGVGEGVSYYDWSAEDGTIYGVSAGGYLPVTISGHMKEEAGNEYQGLTIEGASITVQATQLPEEYDSYNNTYDAGAEFDKIANITTQEQLNAAVTNATEPVTLMLSEGTYIFPAMNNKEITIAGTKDTKVVVGDTKAVWAVNSDVTFSGVTVEFTTGAYYNGIMDVSKLVYKDCVLNGTQYLDDGNVDYINCTFNVSGDAYAVWTWAADNVTFTNCTFNTDGKALLVYSDGENHANVTLTKCTFNDNEGLVGEMKGAIEVGSSPYSAATTYNIYMSDCTVNGFAVNNKGISTGSTFWGNKNSMDKDHLNVVIDGVDVY